MATIGKSTSVTWKALIRKTGWPATAKTFRTKRDAEDSARGAYSRRCSTGVISTTTDNPISSFAQIIVLALIILFAQRNASG